MRSKKVTLTIPNRLWDAYEKHALEVGYTNAKQMLVWDPLYSLMVGRPHLITGPLSQCPMQIQDEIIEDIVSSYERGEFTKGTFLGALLDDVVTRLGVTATPETLRAVIADAIRNRPRRKKGG